MALMIFLSILITESNKMSKDNNQSGNIAIIQFVILLNPNNSEFILVDQMEAQDGAPTPPELPPPPPNFWVMIF